VLIAFQPQFSFAFTTGAAALQQLPGRLRLSHVLLHPIKDDHLLAVSKVLQQCCQAALRKLQDCVNVVCVPVTPDGFM